MPYNLPYSEYVDADPTVEDMNSVVNIKVSIYRIISILCIFLIKYILEVYLN